MAGDVTTIVSLLWGSTWGYDVQPSQVRFARRLIDAGVDLAHGHSSHHPRPIEVYRGKLTTLHMTPLRARIMRLHHASHQEAEWLRSTLRHISRHFETRVDLDIDTNLAVRASWSVAIMALPKSQSCRVFRCCALHFNVRYGRWT